MSILINTIFKYSFSLLVKPIRVVRVKIVISYKYWLATGGGGWNRVTRSQVTSLITCLLSKWCISYLLYVIVNPCKFHCLSALARTHGSTCSPKAFRPLSINGLAVFEYKCKEEICLLFLSRTFERGKNFQREGEYNILEINRITGDLPLSN